MKDPKEPWVLGLSSSHNGSACLLRGSEIVVAIQEERLLRYKRAEHPGADASLAIRYCLDAAGISPVDLSGVVLCPTWPATWPREDLSQNPLLQTVRNGIPTFTIPHHLGHAIAVFASSGFPESAVLIVDGSGSPWEDLPEEERALVSAAELARHSREQRSAIKEMISIYVAADHSLKPVQKHLTTVSKLPKSGMRRFGSLGDMYGFVGRQIFGSFFESPGKVMGLAPYGTPDVPIHDFFEIIDNTVVFKDVLPERYTHDVRWPNRQTEYSNLAASVQAALEHALFHFLDQVRTVSSSNRLCYAGGVALNSVANEKLIGRGLFDEVFMMPAAEDSGPAIGAAYYGLWQLTQHNTRRRCYHDSVGRQYAADEIATAINAVPGIVVSHPSNIITQTVDLLVEGKLLGWFQGRSELGPRALGQRSILCDPRNPGMKEQINSKVKFREGFRPFAPAVLSDHVHDWFEIPVEQNGESPFMLRVMSFRKDKAPHVPAVVHVDGTGRLQTVTAEVNGRFYEVIAEFYRRTNVPILLNTSFNIAGEPIVETPDDALWCFLYTDLDGCVLEDQLVQKLPGIHPILDNVIRLTTESVSLEMPSGSGPLICGGHDRAPMSLPIVVSCHASSRIISHELSKKFAASMTECRTITKLHTRTKWGQVTTFVDCDLTALLSLCNGRLIGRKVLKDLRSTWPDFSEDLFVRIIASLRRASIIRIESADVGEAQPTLAVRTSQSQYAYLNVG